MSKARDLADFISTGSILSDGTIESTEISGVTAVATELNILDGVTATTAELNKLAGTSATTSDFDKLSNVTASATELNYMTGATSSIQSQLDNISVTSGSLTKSFTSGESATITLAQSITPAPVVSVTKEVAQTGQSSKGAWDVNATASNYDLHNTAYATTLTPNTSTSTLTLGTGSFTSTDVGKRIQGNGGDVILTSTAGTYDAREGSGFTDSSPIASGSWTMHGLKSAGADVGLTLPKGVVDGVAGSGVSTLDIFGDSSGVSTLSLDSNLSDLNTSNTWQGTYNGAASPVKWGSQSLSILTGDTTSYGAVYDLDLSANNNSYTISCWFHITDIRTGINAVMAMTSGSGTVGHGMITVSNGVFGKGTTSGTTLLTGYDSGQTISPNTWYHGVATYDGSTDVYKMYLDGSLVLTVADASTTAVSHTPDLDTPTNVNVLLGHEPDSFYPFGGFSGTQNLGGYIDQVRIFDKALTDQEVSYLYTETPFDDVIPAASYNIAVTNTNGQIDSQYWTDINSMTADQSLGDGEAYYAVSTDDRTTWSVAKASDGVRPIVRDNAGTWQYNSAVSSSYYDIASASYDSKSGATSSAGTNAFTFNDDGTKVYTSAGYFNDDYIREYPLSTAFDISTIGTVTNSLLVNSVTGQPNGIELSSDGTKMYVVGADGPNDILFEYDLSTAFDLSTATYNNVSLNITGQTGVAYEIRFKPDGTKFFLAEATNDTILEYNLTTAWDLSTASYSNNSFSVTSQENNPQAFDISSDGTKMAVGGGSGTGIVYFYNLSTAWDITTASYSGVSFDASSQGTGIKSLKFNNDGSKMFIMQTFTIYQYSTVGTEYSTSTTWTNATTNDEFYALQQALGATEFNRMDKTQLDAVADGSHFTLGNTLDLMIALKQDTASASLPTSDGVTINYDAEALNQGAVLGTDYDFDFPANNKVRITSNAAQNLKIRVV